MIYFTIDLESWVHRDMNLIKDFASSTSENRKYWDKGYIQESTKMIITKILELKRNNKNIEIIFFIPGEIYDWYPEIIETISKNFKIGLHSYSHRKLLTEKILIDELEKSKDFISEYNMKWFRAPEVYIEKSYFKNLQDYGFENDSSIYGVTKSFMINNITEMPISTYPYPYSKINNIIPKNLTLKLLRRELPFGSGLFLNILPRIILQNCINYYKKEDLDLMLFIHQWQIYPFNNYNFFLGLPRSLLAAGYFTGMNFAKIESFIKEANIKYEFEKNSHL